MNGLNDPKTWLAAAGIVALMFAMLFAGTFMVLATL